MKLQDKRWPADKIERRPIGTLIPYARNSRTHTPAQIDLIASSIRQWGWTSPVLCDEEGTLIAGHARIMAAKKLGLTEVPVMVAEGWTDAQKSAYVIADNKIAITGSGWDEDMLAVELKGLAEEGFDLGLTGFSLKEIGSLNKGLGRGGDAPMQDTPESWVVIIECTDEQDQVELIERMQEEGRKVRGSIA